MGAYDEAHWQTAVGEIKPGIGVLRRGTVLCAGSGLTLASWCLPLPANVRRFARCGGVYHRSLFRWLGHRLCCSRRFIPRPRTHRQCVGINAATLADTLRENGIFVENPITVPKA